MTQQAYKYGYRMKTSKTVKTRLKIKIESYQYLEFDEFKRLVRWYFDKYGVMYGDITRR